MTLPELSANELADLTGVAPGTLRVWETRHGFPTAHRGIDNRKRYTGSDVDQVRAVLEYRRAGMSLTAAITRVRAGEPERPQSLFAVLREARPDLPVRVYPKRLLIALSRAVEDEQAAHAPGGILIGSFQREDHFRTSQRRWRQLARTAELSVALGAFPALRDPGSGTVEVPLPDGHPLEREWAVVVHSSTASACLAGWEVPEPRPVPDLERRFEVVWSCDPHAAQAAVLSLSRLFARAAPDLAGRIPPTVLTRPTASAARQRFCDDLTARAFAYLSEAAGTTVVAAAARPVPVGA